MPGVFKLCASCLGYNALGQREESRVPEEAEAVMLDTTAASSTKARMGILKMKREKELDIKEGEENLLACKNDEEGEDQEGDSGACVDEFPVAKDADVNSGGEKEAEPPPESSAETPAKHDDRDISK